MLVGYDSPEKVAEVLADLRCYGNKSKAIKRATKRALVRRLCGGSLLTRAARLIGSLLVVEEAHLQSAQRFLIFD